jgi:hypothetical protein
MTPLRDGVLDKGGYNQFMSNAEVLIESLQASVQNISVLLMLLISMAIALAVMEISPPFDGRQDAWGPLSSGWLTGGDEESTHSLERAFYLAETTLLSICVNLCVAGIVGSIMAHEAISYMPSRAAAIKFVLANPTTFSWLQVIWLGSLDAIIIAVPFTLARYSVVAFLVWTAAIPPCMVLLYMMLGSRTRWTQRFLLQVCTRYQPTRHR